MRKLTLSLAVMAALLPARGYPLGLGEIELNSALNQELNAEIEVLSATPDDANQMIVQLANREAFNRAGIDRPYLLQQLKFKIVEKDGRPFVKVYTKSAIREPFISFLLEIDWPQGHLLREYTLLLDPPVYNTGGSTSVSSEESHPFIDPSDVRAQPQSEAAQQQSAQSPYGGGQASGMQTGSISSDSGRSMTYRAPQSAPVSPSVSTPSVDQYRVKQSDTLWSMANRMRPDSSVSVEQMMLALVRKNPEAFIKENINGVKRGYILRIPDREEATQLDRQQAVAQAREHSALWREYSQSSVSDAPASSMEAEAPAMGADGVTTESQGHLSIVGASEDDGSEHAGTSQDPGSELARLKQELATAREELESERAEKEGLQSRLSDLEQKVQSAIQMDDAELAKLQQEFQQQAEPAEESGIEAPVEAEIAEEPAVTEETVADEATDMPVEEAAVEDVAEETADAETATEDAVFVDELETPEGEPAVDASQVEEQLMPEPAEAIEPPAFAQQKPKSFIENLMNDPKLLGMIGGGLAFVLLLLGLLLKRLRGGKKEDQEDLAVGDLDDLPDMDDATIQTEAADVSTADEPSADLGMEDTQIDVPAMDEESLEDTVFSLNDVDEEPAADEQQDDVLAEADVYLAYGIYQQAEDLLKNAIDKNPERDDYRMKLLETHFAAKNSSAFEQAATEAKSRKGDDAAYWGRVATMGAELCPTSELFSGAGDVISDFDADALIPEKPATTDVELDAGDDQPATDLESDLGLDLGDTTETEAFSGDLSDDLSGDLGLGDMSDLGSSDLETSEGSGEAESLDESLDLADDLANITSQFEATDEAVQAEGEAESLEFDLGEIDEGSTADEVSAEEEMDDLDIDEDFSLDFAASDLGFEEHEDEAASEASSESVGELDLEADLDLGEGLEDATLGDEAPAAEEDSMEMDLTEELGGDLDEIDLDADAGEESVVDDSGLDLDADLDLGDSVELEEPEIEADDLDVSIDDSDDDFDISELSEDIDEVATKLDLAKAYIDMGDNEGARSILEEVKSEGSAEQQQEAESLLEQAG